MHSHLCQARAPSHSTTRSVAWGGCVHACVRACARVHASLRVCPHGAHLHRPQHPCPRLPLSILEKVGAPVQPAEHGAQQPLRVRVVGGQERSQCRLVQLRCGLVGQLLDCAGHGLWVAKSPWVDLDWGLVRAVGLLNPKRQLPGLPNVGSRERCCRSYQPMLLRTMLPLHKCRPRACCSLSSNTKPGELVPASQGTRSQDKGKKMP